MVEYAGDLCDIKMLATSQNDMEVKDVAYKLEHVCLEKMLQLEDNAAKKGTQFKALILGLGKRVRVYKQEIAAAKSLDSKKEEKRPCAFDGTVGPQTQKASNGEAAGDSSGKHVYIGCIWAKEQEAEERHLSWEESAQQY